MTARPRRHARILTLGGLVLAGAGLLPAVLEAQTAQKPSPPATASPPQPAPPSPLPKPRPGGRANLGELDLDTEAIRAEIARNAAFQTTLRQDLEAARTDRGKLNRLLLDATTRIRTVEQQLIDLEPRLATLDRSAADLRQSLLQRRDLLAEVLAALVRMGRNPPPALLMRPDDALDSVRSAILLGALLPELRVEAETLAADLSELSRVRAEMVSAQDALKGLRTALEEDRVRIGALVEERQKREAEAQVAQPGDRAQAELVARNTPDVHDLVTRLETEVAPASRAADAAKAGTGASVAEGAPGTTELAALSNPGRLSPAMPFAQAKGLLPLPVAGVRVREFGATDAVGVTEKGLTIATRAGAQVASPVDGWVVYAGPFRSYGQLLIINAGGGYHILMAGMERISVDLGQFVLTGEPVAVMGGGSRSAGSASGQPQLYVEFRKDGVSIDPAPWWAATDSQKVRG
ncbi:peptidoglycan DD-metalloendopeptidase family protein [Aquabacter sp. L1I39]|uniref:murein hydrolase activator EnvC family protein n=1 Tax=Aquabacter sp. L1I39 TaxID=2820278 RepID=UPI001AD9A3BB|nr:peptidoglycan DD-metalloendopeptidase family protein [Aquabacter sp. L1I39]QTL01989.1 peptidoglycan DD-metalloendopeptidase family protein [Aquabacter sp. L1I39]